VEDKEDEAPGRLLRRRRGRGAGERSCRGGGKVKEGGSPCEFTCVEEEKEKEGEGEKEEEEQEEEQEEGEEEVVPTSIVLVRRGEKGDTNAGRRVPCFGPVRAGNVSPYAVVAGKARNP